MVKINRLPALSFDDVLIEPNYSAVKRGEADVTPKSFKNIAPKIPIISSPMSCVTEIEMAHKMINLGGLGIHHRYCDSKIVFEFSKKTYLLDRDALSNYGSRIILGSRLPIAVGSVPSHQETIDELISLGHKFFCVDVANGTSERALETLRYIRERVPEADIMSGNVATAHQARLCINAGANVIRSNVGPGSVCETRVKTGVGIPALQSILDISKMINYPTTEKERELFKDIIVVSDGGIRTSGDIVKALAAGASYVILGKLLAGSEESPGLPIPNYTMKSIGYPSTITKSLKEVIDESRSAMKKDKNQWNRWYKLFYGMASAKALVEENGKNPEHLHLEGIETITPYTGPVANTINELINGLKQALFYVGASNLEQLKNVTFRVITNNGVVESGPHGRFKD
jgi:IMP dehydrogenase